MTCLQCLCIRLVSGYDSFVAFEDHSTRESAATLVHAFLSSRLDYCNAVFAPAPMTITTGCNGWWTSLHVSSVVAVVCRDFCTPSFIGLTFQNKSGTSSVCASLLIPAEPSPRYLTDHCTPVSTVTFRQCLRSASSHQLVVPRYTGSAPTARLAFSVAGPVTQCTGTRCRMTYETLNFYLKTFLAHYRLLRYINHCDVSIVTLIRTEGKQQSSAMGGRLDAYRYNYRGDVLVLS